MFCQISLGRGWKPGLLWSTVPVPKPGDSVSSQSCFVTRSNLADHISSGKKIIIHLQFYTRLGLGLCLGEVRSPSGRRGAPGKMMMGGDIFPNDGFLEEWRTKAGNSVWMGGG